MLNDHAAAAPQTIVTRPLPQPQITTADEHEAAHTDYDLQPLRVHPLQRYFEYSADSRFHVH